MGSESAILKCEGSTIRTLCFGQKWYARFATICLALVLSAYNGVGVAYE